MERITKRLAIERGLDTYYNGPCVHGHTKGRSTSTGRCLECDRKRTKERQKLTRNAEAKRAREAARYRVAREKCWRSYILQQVKKRAKKKGLEFDLTIDDIPMPGVCPVFGTPLEYVAGNRYERENSPSIDRINNDLGYVKGNIEVISYRANRYKNNSSVADMRALFAYMRKRDRDTEGFSEFMGD